MPRALPHPITTCCLLCNNGRFLEALQSVEHVIHNDRRISIDCLMRISQGCSRKKDLAVGRQVYAVASKNEFLSDSKLVCQLIRMFSSCGSIEESLAVFAPLPSKNFYSWTAVISAFTQHGLHDQALEMYMDMQLSGIKVTPYVAVAVIKSCAYNEALNQGKLIHSDVMKQELWSDVFVGSALVDMYCKCGSVNDAFCVFDSLSRKDVVVWSAMAAGCAQLGYGMEALQLYERMLREGVEPNEVTFVSVLNSCTSMRALDRGFLHHQEITEAISFFNKMQREGIEPNKPIILCLLKSFGSAGDVNQVKLVHLYITCQHGMSDKYIENSLVDAYSKCGNVMDASKIFYGLQKPDVVSWNAMIAGYADCELGDKAFDLFRIMKTEGRNPDEVTFLSVLKACISMLALAEGMLIHVEIMKQSYESDLFVGSTLIVLYAKCGSVEDAHNVFDRLSTKNAVSWNALIAGYAHCGFITDTVKLFQKMCNEGIEPNLITSLSMLRTCAVLTSLDLGNLIYSDIVEQGYQQENTIHNALIDMYVKCGIFEDAERVLDMMLMQDVVSWSSLIAGYVDEGIGEKALQVFVTMQYHGIEPNKVSYMCALKACSLIGALIQGQILHAAILKQELELESSVGSCLIDMYAKCGNLDDAHKTFEKLPECCVVCWSALIGGYADNDNGEKALELYDEMQFAGVIPNEVTCLSVMRACASLSSLHYAKCTHQDIIERSLEISSTVGSTLVDMYVKCGSLENALGTFDTIIVKDVVSWNSIIGGYADYGIFNMARFHFMAMQLEGVKPDTVTFVCLLYACSHSGLLREGYIYFKAMIQDYELPPRVRHFVCMIDLLGRAGCLHRAEELVLNLPCEANSAVFLSLLGSCAKYRETEIGSRLFNSLHKFDCRSSSTYVLMSNMYSSNDLIEDGYLSDDVNGEVLTLIS